MAELSEFLTNAELVTSVLGSWPSLHDAEIITVKLSRDAGITAELTINAIHEPSEKPRISLIMLLFKGVEELELVDFNEQNVVWDLTVERDGDKKKLVISSSYGLAGGFYFTEAEVLRVEPLN